jgi:hypothetical protein
MSLEYKTHAYIRKAIRQAEYVQADSGIWSAVSPALGLRATGENRDDAEQNLLIMITAYVLGAPQFGWPLPAMDDIDFGADAGPGYVRDDVHDPDASWRSSTSTHGVDAEIVPATQGALTLTARESLTVAKAIVHPPDPNGYMLQAAYRYREFMGL